jgi:hypothetical protein
MQINIGIFFKNLNVKEKIKLSLYRPWRPIGLREVEAPTFSDFQLNRWWQSCQPHAPAAFYPPGRFLVLIFFGGYVEPRAIVRLEGLGKLKKKIHLIRDSNRRTSGL